MKTEDHTKIDAATYLRRESRQEHTLTELCLDSQKIMQGRMSLEAYIALLRTQYAIWSWANEKVFISCYPELLPYADLADTLSKAAARDLHIIGLSSLPEVESVDEPLATGDRFGIAYVLLGSLLGGKIQYDRIRSCSELKDTGAFNFYQCCVSFSPLRWRTFTSLLNQLLPDDTKKACALLTVKATFALFRRNYLSFYGKPEVF